MQNYGQALLYLLACCFLVAPTKVAAVLRNVTIDDRDASISYISSTKPWNAEPGCTVCQVTPDPALAHDGTWHDATYLGTGATQTFSFDFTGKCCFPP